MFQYSFLAKITDNEDPDGLQRVKVTKLGDQESVSGWIPYITPFAGNDAGLTLMPDIGDLVSVVSLGKSSGIKAALGSMWFNDATPPETGENSGADLNQDGKNSLRFIKSRSGHMLIFDDTEGAEKIQIISSDGKSRIEFSVADELVSTDTEGDILLNARGTISIQAEEVEINSKKQFSISAKEYQLSAEKGIEVETSKEISVKGKGISLN